MDNQFREYVEKVHREPYNPLTNNCYHKSWKIIKEALRQGKDADLITCPMRPPFPFILPHFYSKVDGEIIDVAFTPRLEKIFGKGTDKPYFLPFNLSKARPEAVMAEVSKKLALEAAPATI